MKRAVAISLLVLAAMVGALSQLPVFRGTRDKAPRKPDLKTVRSWACQLQGLENPGAVDRLARAPVDMLVIETTDTVRGSEDFPIRAVVARLQAGEARRLVLAYLNVGQAEDYRTYWTDDWRCPVDANAKRVGFIICPDPEGWEGNFPVAYWDPAWRRVLYGSATALLDRIVAQGFDGVYLDWVLGFVDDTVKAAAKREGVNPERAMAELLRDLRSYARRTHPEFLVIAQNPGHLIEVVPEVADWIDGVSQEGLVHFGAATSDWNAAEAGGRRRRETGDDSTDEVRVLLTRYLDRGLPVFTMDYATKDDDIAATQAISRAAGFVPFVSRTPLDRLPAHLFAQQQP